MMYTVDKSESCADGQCVVLHEYLLLGVLVEFLFYMCSYLFKRYELILMSGNDHEDVDSNAVLPYQLFNAVRSKLITV